MGDKISSGEINTKLKGEELWANIGRREKKVRNIEIVYEKSKLVNTLVLFNV